MSDIQFSSLSPNSSYDQEIRVAHQFDDELDMIDQETLSTKSDSNELEDYEFFSSENFSKEGSLNLDPFLTEEIGFQMPNNYFDDELNGLNINNYNSNMMLNDYDLDDNILYEMGDFADYELDYQMPTISPFPYYQSYNDYSNGNKRSLNQIYSHETFVDHSSAKKLRKIEPTVTGNGTRSLNMKRNGNTNTVTYNINYNDRVTLKASGLLDRRKTKHHKILREVESETILEKPLKTTRKDAKITSIKFEPVLNTNAKYPINNNNNNNNNHNNASYQTLARPKPFVTSMPSTLTFPQRTFPITSHSNPANYSANNSSTNYPANGSSAATQTILPQTLQSRINAQPSVHSNNNNEINPIDINRIPEPLRMGKKVYKRGQRFSLWQFLMYLLDSKKYADVNTGIRWINRKHGIFHISDSKQVATLWGQYKERRGKMTYDSLARSLRHYYKKNLMAKINNRRLVYQIAQECIHWSSDSFIISGPPTSSSSSASVRNTNNNTPSTNIPTTNSSSSTSSTSTPSQSSKSTASNQISTNQSKYPTSLSP